MQGTARTNFFSRFLSSVSKLNLHTFSFLSLSPSRVLVLLSRSSFYLSFPMFGSSVPHLLPQKKATSSQNFFSVQGSTWIGLESPHTPCWSASIDRKLQWRKQQQLADLHGTVGCAGRARKCNDVCFSRVLKIKWEPSNNSRSINVFQLQALKICRKVHGSHWDFPPQLIKNKNLDPHKNMYDSEYVKSILK